MQLAVSFVGPNENSRNLKVGLKFSFWKARISFSMGEMSLQKSSLQEKSNTIKKTKNLKIETDYI
jgi:hypothetical protein